MARPTEVQNPCGEYARRAASGDEHDLVAIEHRERTDLLRSHRDPIQHRLQHCHHLARAQIGSGQRQHAWGEAEQLAIRADKPTAVEGEEDAARSGARKIGGACEIAQRHRPAGGTELL
jgi:hypothetical protein